MHSCQSIRQIRVETNRQDIKQLCERWVVCRRAKIKPHIAAALDPLHVPPQPWHTIGIGHLRYFYVSNGFDIVLIVVVQMTRMDHFMPCT
jgi:hypothetical protein